MTFGPYRTIPQAPAPPVVDPPPERAAGDCPGCRGQLRSADVEGVPVQACAGCEGHFVTHDAMDRIASVRRRSKDAPHSAIHSPVDANPDRSVECIVCRARMKKSYFSHGCPVMVDICVAHGTWFDRLELDFALESIQRGAVYHRPDTPPSRRPRIPPPPVRSNVVRDDRGFEEMAALADAVRSATERRDAADVKNLVEKMAALAEEIEA